MATAQTQPSITSKAIRFVLRDVLLDVVRFPVWWYTTGTAQAWRFVLGELLGVVDRLSLRILLRNFFKPMYGDYTRSGRIISFFMRLITFIFKFFALTIWTVLLFGLFVAWLAIIPLTVLEIVFQLTG